MQFTVCNIHRQKKKTVVSCVTCCTRRGAEVNSHGFDKKSKVAYRNTVQYLHKCFQHSLFVASAPDMPKFTVTLDKKR